MYGTFWALVPPIIAIILALITKEAYSSLFIGIVVGALFCCDFAPVATLDTIVNDGFVKAIVGNAGIFLFLVILGVIVALVNSSGGSAAAVATASGVFVRVLLPSALAEAEAGSVGDYIRTLFFSALAEAVATASGTGVSTYGSVTMVIEGVNMVAGDELIIDTEHMTVTLNGANIIDRVSDDSAFFKLQPGENDIIVEGGTTADVKILWKDRWL